MPAKTDPEQRFWLKVQKTETCWLWTGFVYNNGYGRFYPGKAHGGRKEDRAHRYSYELHYGAVDRSLDIDHRCKVRHCVRPDHLRILDQTANRGQWNREKTHCRNGHEYNEKNTYYNGGKRFCRVCGAARAARYRKERE